MVFLSLPPHVIPRMSILHVIAFVDVCVHLCVECVPTFAGTLPVHSNLHFKYLKKALKIVHGPILFYDTNAVLICWPK